tara:strand:+ start:536 stop:910 length:375 start_codon:yes stop_codon:yes gene_type:complete
VGVHNVTTKTLWSAEQLTGTSRLNSTAVNVAGYTEASIYVKVTAKSGTTPAAALDVEVSHDNSEFHKDSDITTITDPTVTTDYLAAVHKVTNLGARWLRVSAPSGMGGSSTPTFTVTVKADLKN